MVKDFKVRDFRNKQFHLVDDEYLNGYARLLDPFATVIYLSLCRHADRDQICFPSQELLAQEHNIGVRTVIEKIKLLEKWHIIRIERERTEDGRWLRNTYYLLDKSEWKPKPSAGAADGQPSAADCNSQVQELHTKDTHNRREHIKRNNTNVYKDISWLTSLSKDDIIQLQGDYPDLPENLIRNEAKKAHIWLEERKNGESKNPKLFLRNWLDKVVERYKNNYAQTKPTIDFQQ